MARETAGFERQVSVGALQFTCVPTGLRHVRFGGTEVLSGVYLVVRDPFWGTLVPEVLETASSHDDGGCVAVRWRARQSDGEISFGWEGVIEARSAGPGEAELSFTVDGSAETEFLANRVGLCLLHPMALAGLPAQTLAARCGEAGEWTAGRFPADVAPWQPFLSFSGLRHPLPAGEGGDGGDSGDGGTAEIIVTGDAFEMEDQRNWTDASFKSYCPPLDRPHPRRYLAGQRVAQQMRLRLSRPAGAAGTAGGTPGPAAARRADGAVRIAFKIDDLKVGRLPAIGLGLADGEVPVTDTDQDLLRALRPGHLHALIDLGRVGWRDDLRRALDEAAALGCRADLEIVVAGPGELGDVAAALAPGGDRAGAARRVFVYERQSSQTTAGLAAAWAASGFGAPSGGSRADFAQLNRAELAPELLNAVAFGLCPQVHATDDESIMETITAQPVVTRCALALAQGHPLVVGPITLTPRFNPVAPDAPRPRPRDPRQAMAITAAWTAGSIAALGYAGASALTFFETAGAGGVLAGAAPLPEGFPVPGAVYPVYHVLARLAPLAGRPLLAARSQDPARVAGLAVDAGPGPLVVLANLRPEPVAVEVTSPFALDPRRPPTVALEPWQVLTLGG
jgi:hypothetical protein